MNTHENIQLLRRAAELSRSVNEKLDACYQAHLETTGQQPTKAA